MVHNMERLTIRDYSWGISRSTGERSERLLEEKVFDGPFEVGQIFALKQTNKTFELLNIIDDGLEIVFSPKKNVVLKGFKVQRPLPSALSMDGGHHYEFLYEYDYLDVMDEEHNLISRFKYVLGKTYHLPEKYKRQIYIGPDCGFNLDEVTILSDGRINFAYDDFRLENDVENYRTPLKAGPNFYFKLHLIER